ncbi:plasmid pRiA4b ORF-3 family protein [uncultured Thiocystis sp.]|jgi:hypothetical protein|uniref:plasmid pRiA4b ORF-3 family protein n=1 Tax=uncultured Thiocystis sp. TaxID=1202134 RepID=UPI0025E45530|nr:plasmid pRiA4b ORF-3 family protein [uncultured Thiocystis sp.]
MTKDPRKIDQLKIALSGAKPPIWRRLLIVDTVPLPVFHAVLQIVMGWEDSHLHQFVAGGNYYGTPDPDDPFSETLNESRYKLSQLLKKEKDSLIYEYDFGDSWEHKVTLEKILPFDPEAVLPRCIKGKGACPPEDVGGIWGYYGFLEALRDPQHPEHEDYKDWIGGDFDPDAFDLDEINAPLLEYFR